MKTNTVVKLHQKIIVGALTLVGVLATSFVVTACYPSPTERDPVNLVWEEGSTDGFHALQKLEAAPGLHAFWWNVAWGQYNHDGSLDQNVQELMRSQAAPDVIAFGEYKDIVFRDPQTLKSLHENYPYFVYAPYDSLKGSDGVIVFSRHPFEQRIVANLDWTPVDRPAAEQDAYRKSWESKFHSTVWWDRPYVKLNVHYLGTDIGLVAVHLLESWGELHEGKGNIELVRQLLTSTTSPLAYQAKRLKAEMRADFGLKLERQPMVLLGDLNVPKSMFGINTSVFELISEDMENVFMREPVSFPALSAPDRNDQPFKTIGGIKIDHALVAGGMKPVGAAVLALKGSDHYPIYVNVSPP